MGEDSITVEILRSIRDELREVRDETRRNGERLDRVVQEQIRHATAMVGLEAGQRALVDGVHAMTRELHGLNDRIDNVLTGPVGSTVRATSDRVDRLEARVEILESKR